MAARGSAAGWGVNTDGSRREYADTHYTGSDREARRTRKDREARRPARPEFGMRHPRSSTHALARRAAAPPSMRPGPLFVRWITLHDRCNVCGLRYLRNQGDTWLCWIVMDRIPIAVGLG